MKSIHPLGALTAIVSIIFFVAAFSLPFVCSDFGFPSESMQQTTQALNNPCTMVVGGEKSSLSRSLLQQVLKKTVCDDSEAVRKYTYTALDQMLGPVPTAEGDLDWYACVNHPEIHQQPISSCCDVSPPIDTCLKWKLADEVHVPLGDQYVLGIIKLLFSEGHILLGALITIFSVLFPFSKVALLLLLSIQERKPKLYGLLKSSSRWSMTDVFVIALLMVYFRADRFAFQFHAGMGVYCFALGAILSSVGISLLRRRHSKIQIDE